jgi:hypothetical protein
VKIAPHACEGSVPPDGPDGYICQRCRRWIVIEHVCRCGEIDPTSPILQYSSPGGEETNERTRN